MRKNRRVPAIVLVRCLRCRREYERYAGARACNWTHHTPAGPRVCGGAVRPVGAASESNPYR